MKQLRSSRHLIKNWQRRDKAADDRLVRTAGGEAKSSSPGGHSAFTASGLAIEDQLRKAWTPWSMGLATF